MLAGEASAARTEAIAELAAKTPLRRIAEPLEIAEVIAFLADSERSSFVTGAVLAADGGALAGLGTE
jgi:NAD(P)-dependent dehydrogenase (short-subunit alcohol dehydrogenase family)